MQKIEITCDHCSKDIGCTSFVEGEYLELLKCPKMPSFAKRGETEGFLKPTREFASLPKDPSYQFCDRRCLLAWLQETLGMTKAA